MYIVSVASQLEVRKERKDSYRFPLIEVLGSQLYLYHFRVLPDVPSHRMVLPSRPVAQGVGYVGQGVFEQDLPWADDTEDRSIACVLAGSSFIPSRTRSYLSSSRVVLI